MQGSHVAGSYQGKNRSAPASLQVDCSLMARLIQTNLSATRKAKDCERSPPCPFNYCTGDVFSFQRLDGFIQIVAHQIEHAAQQFVISMLLYEITFGRMHCQFCRRHGEDQPVMAEID